MTTPYKVVDLSQAKGLGEISSQAKGLGEIFEFFQVPELDALTQ